MLLWSTEAVSTSGNGALALRNHCSHVFPVYSTKEKYIVSSKWLWCQSLNVSYLDQINHHLKQRHITQNFYFELCFRNVNLGILCRNLLKTIWSHGRIRFPSDEARIAVHQPPCPVLVIPHHIHSWSLQACKLLLHTVYF